MLYAHVMKHQAIGLPSVHSGRLADLRRDIASDPMVCEEAPRRQVGTRVGGVRSHAAARLKGRRLAELHQHQGGSVGNELLDEVASLKPTWLDSAPLQQTH